MAYWDSEKQKIIISPPEPCVEYPNWEIVDCGCCAGIEWGGWSPSTCSICKGNGILYHHIKSGVLALYPGGPFIGRG